MYYVGIVIMSRKKVKYTVWYGTQQQQPQHTQTDPVMHDCVFTRDWKQEARAAHPHVIHSLVIIYKFR
jgi:hypothetical protein